MPTWRKGLWDIIITLCPSLFLSVTFTSTFQSSALKTLGTNVTRNWMVHCIYFFIGNPPQKPEVSSWCQKGYFLPFLWSAFFSLFFCECFVFIIQTVYWKNSWVIQTWVSLKLIYYNLQISSGSCCYFSTFKDLYLFHL